MAELAGLARQMQKHELTNILDRPMLYGRQSAGLQHACSLMGCPTQGPPAEPASLLPAEGVQASGVYLLCDVDALPVQHKGCQLWLGTTSDDISLAWQTYRVQLLEVCTCGGFNLTCCFKLELPSTENMCDLLQDGLFFYEPFTDLSLSLPRDREQARAVLANVAGHSILHRPLDRILVQASSHQGVTCRDLWHGVLQIRSCPCHRVCHALLAAPFQAPAPAPQLYIVRAAETWYRMKPDTATDCSNDPPN